MKIIVVGCGKVGRAIIDSLVLDGHDIVAIDNDIQVIQNITNTCDVMAACGSATSREMLIEAGVSKTDLFVCVTNSDEVNMLSCFLAKKLGAKHTIARIRESNYNEDGLGFITKQLSIDVALNPERLTAEHLYRRMKVPSAVNVETFAGKKAQLLETVLREGSPLVGKTLAEVRQKCPVPFVVCVVQRNEQTHIPTGNFTLQEDDKVAFMIKGADSHKFLKAIGLVPKQARNVIIVGASSIAYYLAKMLADNSFEVKIIEQNLDRCHAIAQRLNNHATLICGDGTDQDILLEEGIKNTDSFVALTGKDEDNILSSFYAMSQKVPNVLAKVNDAHRANMGEKLGLTSPVSPAKIVADVVTRYARALENTLESAIETMYSLMEGQAEALEFVVLPDCKLIGKKLKELSMKSNFIIAGIIRGKETIIPTGEDCMLENDKVIVIASGEHLHDLADVLR